METGSKQAGLPLQVPVIGILRGVEEDFFGELMAAAFEEGLQAIEVTMNTPGAERIVARQRHKVPEGRLLGMGTICNKEEARRALSAGAMFLVTPNFDPEVI
ncbi:MAG: 2-dehydro-3-deoxyphosphogluconate aldolase, partial [Deltaproteobacteria bacterium]